LNPRLYKSRGSAIIKPYWFCQVGFAIFPRRPYPRDFFEAKEVKIVKIYVGNLSYSTSSEDLRTLFEEFGTVESAEVVMDRNTNRSRGFGFTEMSSSEEAKAAISALNGKDVDGRPLNVSEARPKKTDSRNSYRY
jgi:cold-inducible RNA-binding protein